jgi:excisionase family DNA binding protein
VKKLDTSGGVQPTLAELGAARYFVDVAEWVLKRNIPDSPALLAVPAVHAWITATVSSTRNRGDDDSGEWEPTDLLTTAQAADVMNLTQRRVQQKIKAGELRAQKMGRESFLRRRDIA